MPYNNAFELCKYKHKLIAAVPMWFSIKPTF